MIKLHCTVWVLIIFITSCAAEEPDFTIVNKFPHDPAAFTQGLLYHNGVFFESTGLYGRSSLRKVDPETGQVLQQRRLPDQLFAEGLALVNGVLIQITWRERIALLYNSDTFDLIGEFRYNTEGWGLAYDGEQLIMSDGSAQLYFRDPNTFKITKTVTVTDNNTPVTMLNELEYINDEVWANVWQTNDIVRIDPATGQVKQRLDFTGLLSDADRTGQEDVLNGIAYDAEDQRLFITGKLYSYIYQVALP